MKVEKILCPIDFSDFNQAANEHASNLAKAYGAKVVYLFVSNPDIPFASFEHVNTELDEKEAREHLEKIRPTTDVEFEHEVLFGPPAAGIVDYANDNHIDLIVIGTHGRTGLSRLLMGSIAESVVRNAECPVLALKQTTASPQTA